MQRQPRESDEPILDRSTLAWLTIVGLVMGVTTLGVIAWAKRQPHRRNRSHHGSHRILDHQHLLRADPEERVRSVFSP